MELNITKPAKVNAKVLKVHLKVCDRFYANLEDDNGSTLKDYEGYVPVFMPGEHYGDYVILDIDIDSGYILNWKNINPTDVENFINGEDED